MSEKDLNLENYRAWMSTLKAKIHSSRTKAALSVNQELLMLYWELGKEIVTQMETAKWGSNFLERISTDLRHEFPDIKGFSRRNLYSVRQWFLFYSKKYEFVPQAVAQIPWGHNRLIISKIRNIEDAIFYAEETLKNGWARNILDIQIDSNLVKRAASKDDNFQRTLPEKEARIVRQTLKDPYNFDFLGLEDEALEREIENELVRNITNFLLELGKGFAYVGRQYKIEISETDYFIDLLFYHLDLRCFVVIELKSGKFKPEYAGKLNFYLSAVDSQLRKKEDRPSIGILLCRKKDKIEVEYSLRDMNKPIGISEYKLTDVIPDDLKTKLPSIEELEIDLQEKINRGSKE